MGKFIDLTGKRFGRLVVIKRAQTVNKRITWECLCDCGNKIIVKGEYLKLGDTKSCGCLCRDTLIKRNTVHGLSKTPMYITWKNIKRRCYSINSADYKDYGGRGIKVCDEWKNDYKSFYNWAINNGYRKGLTIERIDVDGDYCPENCTWIPMQEQSCNRRNLRYIEFNGETHYLKEWARILNIPYKTLHVRIYKYNWDIERAFTNANKIK